MSSAMVPKIHFHDLELAASAPLSAQGSFSLSGSIIRDNNSAPNSGLDQLLSAGDSTRLSSSLNFDSSFKGGDFTARLGTWRDREESFSRLTTGRSLHTARRNMGRSATSPSTSDMHFLGTIEHNRKIRAGVLEFNANMNLSEEGSSDEYNHDSLSRVYSIIAVLLLQKCLINDGQHLDPACCTSCSDNSNINSCKDQSGCKCNILFTVREYLESVPDCISLSCMSNVANLCSRGGSRLLKLLSSSLFESCVVSHMADASRIADGGFGSVFRAVCPSTCTECLNCMQKGQRSYAVKRLSRERSAHDHPIIINVFSEVSCLERLSGCKGVCHLYDYGIQGGEYWLVLEEGVQNLEQWRSNLLTQANNDKMSVDHMYLMLLIFIDILKIMKMVHSFRITHFDLKCSNFMLRFPLQTSVREMILALSSQANNNDHIKTNGLNKNGGSTVGDEPSGYIFLIDFGESVIQVSEDDQDHNRYVSDVIVRARGTLPIQSPEMLKLTESSHDKIRVSGRTRSDSIKHNQVIYPDNKSDIWSLGCLFVELVLGEHLFSGVSWTELYVLLCLEKDSPLPMSRFQEIALRICGYDISTSMEVMIMKFLQRNSFDRVSLEEGTECARNVCQALLSSNRKLSNLYGSLLATTLSSASSFLDINSKSTSIRKVISNNSKENGYDAEDLNDNIRLQSGLWNLGNNVFLQLESSPKSSEFIWSSSSAGVEELSIGSQGYLNTEISRWFQKDFDSAVTSSGLSKCVDIISQRRLYGLHVGADSNKKLVEYVVCGEEGQILTRHSESSSTIAVVCSAGNQMTQTMQDVKRAFVDGCALLSNGGKVIITIQYTPSTVTGREDFNADSVWTECLCNRMALSVAVTLASCLLSRQSDLLINENMNPIECIDRVIPSLSKSCNKSFVCSLYRYMD